MAGTETYSPIPTNDLNQDLSTVPKQTFFVQSLPEKTPKTHSDFIAKLKDIGQTQVESEEECDYIVVFCPIVSRVGTDIDEALDKAPGGKPITLVVMHHTFKPNHIIADSRRLVTKANVELTVDLLFYEDHFLKCERNRKAWSDMKTFLRVPEDRGIYYSAILFCKEYPKIKLLKILAAVLLLIIVLVILLLVLFLMKVI